ncbi:hypothetical protein MACH26_02670 [Planctobacterium marinum]|uniref:Uncharacterized protein n=1 Tax=Planctobacterium marinum TaxID=1631968 RepID=A0AA48HEA5_9ALTE|nr:hypothetical protein MACH26_02670 [Planctobacterium marinum]
MGWIKLEATAIWTVGFAKILADIIVRKNNSVHFMNLLKSASRKGGILVEQITDSKYCGANPTLCML